MNKTRKNKYLRKNRHGKNSKHKHKTRKVQRGGKALGLTDVEKGIREVTPSTAAKAAEAAEAAALPNGREFLKRPPAPPAPPAPTAPTAPVETQPTTAPAEASTQAPATAPTASTQAPATAQAAEASQPEAAAAAKAIDAFYGQPYNRSSMNDISSAAPPLNAVTTASHAGNDTTTTEIKTINKSRSETNEERDARLGKDALKKNQDAQNPTPELLVVPEGIKNGILGWLSSFFDSSKNKLPKQMAQVAITEQIGDIIKDSDVRVELIRAINKRYIGRINKILENIFNRNIEKSRRGEGSPDSQNNEITVKETEEISRLLTELDQNNIQLEKIIMAPTKLSVAALDGNLAKLDYGVYSASSSGGSAKIPALNLNSNPPPAKKKKDDSPPPPAAAGQKPSGPPSLAEPSKLREDFKNFGNKISQGFNRIMPGRRNQRGGQDINNNKTRKNRQRQYIHEIKQNRTHLFNKEMEILNSIRNFKNGHNDDTKKQFMKAVKRG